MRGYRLGLGVVAAAALLVSGCDRGSHPRGVDKPAPEFALNDGSKSVDLAQLRGHVVVLNFWGTWCPPCLRELPYLIQMQRQMPQVTVLAVDVPDPNEDPKVDMGVYRKFLVDHKVTLLAVRDDAQRVNTMYGTVQFPETYLIDKRGVLRRKFVGEQVWTSAEIMRYLQMLSDERP